MEITNILGLSDIAAGILMILISIPHVLRKIPMNRWMGFRIAKAFESDENWYDINAYGGKALIFWSVVLMLLGVAKIFAPIEDIDNPVAANIILIRPIIASSGIAIIQTLLYARKR
jgi:hypothetical protein